MHTQRDFGYYGPDSVAWKVNREAVVMLGGSRAVLLQLAHPLVAMGVHAHSTYMSDPFGRAERTFVLGEKLSFGSTSVARRAARTINHLHKNVHGSLPLDAGAYITGTQYDARDPELLLWVHATLVDTLLLTYLLFVGRLTEAEQNRYYQESKAVAHLLALQPEQMPATLDDLRQYMHTMTHSDRLAATPQARQLAHQVLFPPAPTTYRPFMHLNLQITCALLPQPVREIYGLEWGHKRQRVFDLSAWSIRQVVPRLPVSLRELPITRKLMQGEMKQSA